MVMGKMGRVMVPRGYYPRKPYVPRPVKSYVSRKIRENLENKLVTNNLAGTFNLLSTTWTELDCSSVATGSTLTGRDGRITRITSFEAKFVLHAVDTPNNTFRMVLGVFDGNQTTPLATAGVTMNNILTPIACRNYLQKKIIDKYITINTANETDRVIKIFKKFKKPLYIKYGDDTVNYPDKKIMLSIISDSGAASHPYVSYGYSIVRFEA